MKLSLAVVGEAEDLSTKAEDIQDAVEEADLADVAEVELTMAMEEEETIGAVYNMIEW